MFPIPTLHTSQSYPPGPRRWVPGQFLFRMRYDPLTFLRRLAREYGDIVHLRVVNRPIYLLNHPDFVRDVLIVQQRSFRKAYALQRAKRLLGEGLLTSEGEFHLQQRRMIQPMFHRRRIAGYGDVMAEYAARASDRWQAGETRDIAEEMTRLTLAIVGKTLFNADIEEDADDIGRAMSTAVNNFGRLMSPLGDLLDVIPLPATRALHDAETTLETIVMRLIAERRTEGDQGDLLSMLLAVQDDAGAGMSDRQIRDEAMTLLLAGHETTANALAWTWYLLSQHPDAEARLHAEVDRVCAGRLPTAADVDQLAYTRMVFSEAMRLYPPAWTIGREATEDVEIGGYVVPTGATVLMSQWVMHHDPRYYPAPFDFRPERWRPGAADERPKYAYFPFGAGSRLCIGERFAWMEGVLILATIAKRWHVQLMPGHRMEPQPGITLRPKYGIQVRLHPRYGSHGKKP